MDATGAEQVAAERLHHSIFMDRVNNSFDRDISEFDPCKTRLDYWNPSDLCGVTSAYAGSCFLTLAMNPLQRSDAADASQQQGQLPQRICPTGSLVERWHQIGQRNVDETGCRQGQNVGNSLAHLR
jgi:hypothetical protein